MQFRVRDAVGFELNEEISTELGLTEGYNNWKKDFFIYIENDDSFEETEIIFVYIRRV